MTYELNLASDYSTGDQPGPTREEILDAVQAFNDAQGAVTGIVAEAILDEIYVYKDDQVLEIFDYLWEFTDWVTETREKVLA